jgi:hypothetical protein
MNIAIMYTIPQQNTDRGKGEARPATAIIYNDMHEHTAGQRRSLS